MENTEKKNPVSEVLAAASNIIVFADNTEKKLKEKLLKRGFYEKYVDIAMSRLKESGVVNDERLIFSATESLANKKLYGKGRIRLELQKMGFECSLISDCFDECIEDIDFKENCLKLACKKRLDKKLADANTVKNAVAALARYGYGYAEIKYAMTRLLENEED